MASPAGEMGTCDRSEPRCFGIPMRWLSLVMLVAQTVGVVFTMRLSRSRPAADGKLYVNTTAVFCSEVIKCCCSVLFLSMELGNFRDAWSLIRKNVFGSPKEAVKVCIPALLYTLQNNLLFVSLSNLSGAVYQVSYQMKILTTAVLSVLILGKKLELEKWLSLLMLTFGVVLIQVPKADDPAKAAQQVQGNSVVGLVAVFSACVTSGLAGVYLEKILKQTDLSIWVRNIQLAFYGGILALVAVYSKDGEQVQKDGFLQGYNSLVWAVILLQAVGGLVVAIVLKYADNLLKCFGNALSICLSCLLSAVVLQEFIPDVFFALGSFLVLLATSTYTLGARMWVEPILVMLHLRKVDEVQFTEISTV